MHITLLVAGALLPAEFATAVCASLDTPRLKERLSRAKSVETTRPTSSALADSGNAHLDWLAQELFSQPSPAATAPYALAEISGQIPSGFVCHADPVHVQVARDHLIVRGFDSDAPSMDEIAQLLDVANELLSNAGGELFVAGDRCFFSSDRDWEIDTLPLAAVIGSSVTMPTGRDAQQWIRLHNEIQIAWHAHLVNQMRESSGARAINGLWLHGGGRWRPLPPIRFAQVQCRPAECRGAAQAAAALGVPLGAEVVDRSLIVNDDLLLFNQQQDWTGWVQAMNAIDRQLAAYDRDAVELVLTGATERTFQSRHSDRYKFWRRRTLAQAFSA